MAFCADHGIPRGFTDLDEAIAWGAFDAAANVTPDAAHHPTTMKLLRAGKHVFCEKPLAVTYADALQLTFSYCAPETPKALVERVIQGMQHLLQRVAQDARPTSMSITNPGRKVA